MILADTSIWADYFDRRNSSLAELLAHEQVLGHAFVTAELALGNLANWSATVAMLESLPQARLATHSELLVLVQRECIQGSGIGFVDAHLVASCRLSCALLWTRDKRLGVQAQRLGCAWKPGLTN
jgi:predicted nucleic acid-binding protein